MSEELEKALRVLGISFYMIKIIELVTHFTPDEWDAYVEFNLKRTPDSKPLMDAISTFIHSLNAINTSTVDEETAKFFRDINDKLGGVSED